MEIIAYDCERHKGKKAIVYGIGEMRHVISYCLKKFDVPVYRYAARQASYHALFGNVISVEELLTICKKEDVAILFAVTGNARGEAEYLYEKGIRKLYSVRKLWREVDFRGIEWNNACQKVINDIDVQFFTEDTIADSKGLYLYSLDAVVTERCSLKCRDCSNLMQYYQHPQDMDVFELKKTIDRLLNKVRRIFDLRILGGEPLMNKEFTRIVDWYQDEKKIERISIYSNGTIFPDDGTLEHLKQDKVFVRLSDYGCLSYKLEEWVRWCIENNVRYEVAKIDKWNDCGRLERHSYSEQELTGVYGQCECRNLPTIKGGYLYNCPYAANAAALEAMTLDEMRRDRLLIADSLSADEIDCFLYERKYLEACRYCKGRNSKQEIVPYIQTKHPLAYKRMLDVQQVDADSIKESGIKMDELVSVVIPAFNVEKYIERCLASVLNSSYRNLEVIVVDDGSEDDTVRLCKMIARRDSFGRVKIIENEHGGVVKARNTGILAAEGKYITFVDADDYVDSERLAFMAEAVVGCDLVCAGYTVLSDEKIIADLLMDRGQSKVEIIPCPIPEGVYERDGIMPFIERSFLNFCQGNVFLGNFLWTCIFRTDMMKSVCERVNPIIWLSEDILLYQIYLCHCGRVKAIKNTGYYYCIRNTEGRYPTQRVMENMEKLFLCLRDEIKKHPQASIFESFLREEYIELLHIGISMQGMTPEVSKRNIYYPYYGRLKGKKIILYGAGNVGKAYYRHMKDDGECLLVAWVDKNAENVRKSSFLPVEGVASLYSKDYDFIVVAVYDEIVYQAIRKELIDTGIREDMIIWNPTKYEW